MLVIFDFDGTLADTWDIFAEEVVAAADRFRYARLDRATLEGLRRLDTREIFRALGVSRWRLPGLVAHLRRRAAARAPEARLFPGIAGLLHALADAGHTLAIASTNAEPTVRAVLGAELAPFISHFACSSSIFGKAARFRKLRRRTGAALPDIVAVGDETRDLDAAAAAGIFGIAVTWGYNAPMLLRTRAPGRTVDTPAALRDMLLRRGEEPAA